MGSRPVSVPIMADLKKYVCGLDTKQENIFNDNFSRFTWKKNVRNSASYNNLWSSTLSSLGGHDVPEIVQKINFLLFFV